MDKRTKILIVLGFIVLAGLASLAVYGFTRSGAAANAPEAEPGKKDSSTGQTISDGIDGVKHGPEDNGGLNPATPVLIGFATLTDQGVLFEDMTTLQNGLSNYFISAADDNTYPPASIVSLSKASCNTPDSDGNVDCSYTLTVNEKETLAGSMTVHMDGDVDFALSKSGSTIYRGTAHRSAE